MVFRRHLFNDSLDEADGLDGLGTAVRPDSPLSDPSDPSDPFGPSPERRRQRERDSRVDATGTVFQRLVGGLTARDRDLQAARDDFTVFMERVMVRPNGAPLVLKDFHREVCEAVQHESSVLALLPRGHMKLCADNQPLLTPDGWRTHGDLRVGDRVFGPDGRPRAVIAVSPPALADREVTFTNGEVIQCNGDHLWRVYDRKHHRWEIQTTDNLSRSSLLLDGEPRYQVQDYSSLQFAERDLPLRPYALGAWLGSGCRAGSSAAPAAGPSRPGDGLARLGSDGGPCQAARAGHVRPAGLTRRGLNAVLKDLGVLEDRRLPDSYKFASEAQRLGLLAGLTDACGDVDADGRVRLTVRPKRLADDIAETVLSLGWRPVVTEVEVPCPNGPDGPRHQVAFWPRQQLPTVRRARSSALQTQTQAQAQAQRLGVQSVRPVRTALPGRCIQVDHPDGMYLVGKSCIPTHNSTILVGYACWRLGVDRNSRIIWVCAVERLAEEFLRQIEDVMLYNQNYRALFGNLVPPPNSGITWTDRQKIVLGRSPFATHFSLYGCGVGGALIGRRADVIIADDVVSDTNSRTPFQREVLWRWLWSVLMPILEPKTGQFIMAGTRYFSGDLYETLAARWGYNLAQLNPAFQRDRDDGAPLDLDRPDAGAERDAGPAFGVTS